MKLTQLDSFLKETGYYVKPSGKLEATTHLETKQITVDRWLKYKINPGNRRRQPKIARDRDENIAGEVKVSAVSITPNKFQ